MTHGPTPAMPFVQFAVIEPGPVLRVWRDGAEFALIPLTPNQAIYLAVQMLTAVRIKS